MFNFWPFRSKKTLVPTTESPAETQLRWGAVSITGNFRQNNEDSMRTHPDGKYFVVADGMGGQSAGERASGLAIELVPKRLDSLINLTTDDPERISTGINDAISFANSEIMALGQLDPECRSMGTTIALAVVNGQAMYVTGVGDSRVYRLRDKELEQLTTDHSLSEYLREAGTISKEEAAVHRYKHVLVRYLGSKEGGTGADVKRIEVLPGDRFVLCSDGVTDGLNDEEITKILVAAGEPQRAAEALVAAAQEGGSRDNITCVVVFVV